MSNGAEHDPDEALVSAGLWTVAQGDDDRTTARPHDRTTSQASAPGSASSCATTGPRRQGCPRPTRRRRPMWSWGRAAAAPGAGRSRRGARQPPAPMAAHRRALRTSSGARLMAVRKGHSQTRPAARRSGRAMSTGAHPRRRRIVNQEDHPHDLLQSWRSAHGSPPNGHPQGADVRKSSFPVERAMPRCRRAPGLVTGGAASTVPGPPAGGCVHG